MPKFKSLHGGHISIYRPGIPTPIEILEGATIETDDRETVRALKASPEVVQVQSSPKPPSSRQA